MLAVDTNLLVYAHRREVPEHDRALAAVRSLAEGNAPWAIPWPCVHEFHSVVTNPRIWREAATSPPAARAQVEAWLGSPSLRLLTETAHFIEVLGPLLERPRVRGPVAHDARIAALCLAHGVSELLTRDRDFSLFPELATRKRGLGSTVWDRPGRGTGGFRGPVRGDRRPGMTARSPECP